MGAWMDSTGAYRDDYTKRTDCIYICPSDLRSYSIPDYVEPQKKEKPHYKFVEKSPWYRRKKR